LFMVLSCMAKDTKPAVEWLFYLGAFDT